MKTAVFPSLRENVVRHQKQREFIARGLTSAGEAKQTGEYHPAEDVLRELDSILASAKTPAKAKSRK